MPDNVTARDLTIQQSEIPQHHAYIYKFRVEQCPLFLQHKCTQHRPFTCFHWHFQNQRRRKPVRRRDGTLNYSADEYCTKYDETTGICQDGDECPFLHRTAGDTERRYHLRYFKTAPCVHETDTRGFCVKNGVHCAFAHGNSDLRNPVYDIRDIRAKETAEADMSGPNALDKERSLLNDDPKWQDTNYVLTNYKTEQCKKPPRLCRQGYACPQYHNSRDRRRSPKKFKYRSTPCPNAKHGEEWGDPSGCDNGDMCQYCHTRTEQQFHPEIYKSTKCHDMQTNSYCPRGSFCAFAHGDFEVVRDNGQYQDGGNNLAELLSSALPAVNNRTYGKENTNLNDLNDGRSIDLLLDNSPRSILDTHSTSSSATASTSVPMQTAYSRLQSLETGESILASSGPTAVGTTIGGFGPLVHPICKPRSLSVPGADMNSSGIDRMISLDRDEWDPITNPDQFDTLSKKSNLYGTGTLGGLLSHLQPAAYFPTAARLSNSTNAPDCVIGHAMDENEEQFKDSSREYESEQPSLCESITMGVGLLTGSAPVNIPRSGLDRHPPRLSPSPPAVNLFSGIRVGAHEIPLEGSNNSTSLFFKRRLRDDAANHQAKVLSLEEDLSQARNACDAWRCKAIVAEQQRDEAVARVTALQNEMRILRDSISVHSHRNKEGEEMRNVQI
ncbi:RING finger protein unkempt-like isoform X3 [Daphnia pulex]|uniref:RING finger protein unkempt-like isoform X3 n=1 Tax=Daphnia pulex TaxID=6669 RepID=UPI001EDFDC5E|nr:RING finger protein unkempt-like isoform X3 [Daphnia pulex]XP_046642570.1 RING finger protein unkempt-like isoform X3 [Daphnia pulicaria]